MAHIVDGPMPCLLCEQDMGEVVRRLRRERVAATELCEHLMSQRDDLRTKLDAAQGRADALYAKMRKARAILELAGYSGGLYDEAMEMLKDLR
jgi:isocitrate lyase